MKEIKDLKDANKKLEDQLKGVSIFLVKTQVLQLVMIK